MAGFDAVLRCALAAAFALAAPSAAAAQDPGPNRSAERGRQSYPDAAEAGSASRAQGARGPVAMLSLEKKRDPADQARGARPAGNGVDLGSMPFAPPAARPK